MAVDFVSGLTHLCTICGRAGVWGPGWSWFGSFRMLDDNPERIIKVCSSHCAAEARKRGLDR